MYLTGTFLDLENRLHQLPDSLGDLNLFFYEACGYYPSTNTIDLVYFIQKWNREFDKKQYPYSVNSWIFAADGTVLLDANGNPILQPS